MRRRTCCSTSTRRGAGSNASERCCHGDDPKPAESSPYRLPWKGGQTHFVAQGNRSFVSHRGSHLHAWDFVMHTGTKILSARSGIVVVVEHDLDGMGLRANYVTIEHADGSRATYAHIQQASADVKVGQTVAQGQFIARAGMVGQTLFPHLHFAVRNRAETTSLPISFADVADGVPRAGFAYTSQMPKDRTKVRFDALEPFSSRQN